MNGAKHRLERQCFQCFVIKLFNDVLSTLIPVQWTKLPIGDSESMWFVVNEKIEIAQKYEDISRMHAQALSNTALSSLAHRRGRQRRINNLNGFVRKTSSIDDAADAAADYSTETKIKIAEC